MPRVFAISDLHLSFASPKPMHVFGDDWRNHPERLKRAWNETVGHDDIVLVPGDVSWAMRLEGARCDLEWVAALPGRKVLLKGNHDYWWASISRVRACLDTLGMQAIQNDACLIDGVAVCGTRLWVAPDLTFTGLPFCAPASPAMAATEGERRSKEDNLKLWQREIGRLRLSLRSLARNADLCVVMTHFPPVNDKGEGSKAAQIIEDHRPDHCVFGHLHGIDRVQLPRFDLERNGVRYRYVSAEYVNFTPVRIC